MPAILRVTPGSRLTTKRRALAGVFDCFIRNFGPNLEDTGLNVFIRYQAGCICPCAGRGITGLDISIGCRPSFRP